MFIAEVAEPGMLDNPLVCAGIGVVVGLVVILRRPHHPPDEDADGDHADGHDEALEDHCDIRTGPLARVVE